MIAWSSYLYLFESHTFIGLSLVMQFHGGENLISSQSVTT